jgi:hypothetical protein
MMNGTYQLLADLVLALHVAIVAFVVGGLVVVIYDAPPWVFTTVYSLFALAVLAAWWYYPPRRKGGHTMAPPA